MIDPATPPVTEASYRDLGTSPQRWLRSGRSTGGIGRVWLPTGAVGPDRNPAPPRRRPRRRLRLLLDPMATKPAGLPPATCCTPTMRKRSSGGRADFTGFGLEAFAAPVDRPGQSRSRAP